MSGAADILVYFRGALRLTIPRRLTGFDSCKKLIFEAEKGHAVGRQIIQTGLTPERGVTQVHQIIA